MKLFAGLIAALLVAAPFQTVSAADKPMPAASMDCATANATMNGMMAMPMMMMPSPAPSGTSMDKNFAMMMQAMTTHGMQMAKLEAACGKDEKTRAMALKMTQDLQNYATQLQDLAQHPY